MNNYEKIGNTIVIVLPEEVDDYNAERMVSETEEMFNDKRIKNVVFDFTNTEMMDSSGIGLITRRFRDVYDRGGKAFVMNENERMEKVLRMSGIYRIAEKINKIGE